MAGRREVFENGESTGTGDGGNFAVSSPQRVVGVPVATTVGVGGATSYAVTSFPG